MRDIKYRAWCPEYKDMTTAFNITARGEIMGLPDDAIVMQFTGLEDKNGKEIYYDDIVQFEFYIKNDEDREHITTPIREQDGYGGTAVIVRTMNYGAGILYDDDDDGNCVAVTEGGQIEDIWEDKGLWDIEVIGNIHENPELIDNKIAA